MNRNGAKSKLWLVIIPVVALIIGVAAFLFIRMFAGGQKPSEGLEYMLTDDGTAYQLTGIGSCTDTKIVIADNYEGLPVIAIGEYALSDCKSVTDVEIPDGVKYIGDSAFSGCVSLKNINIPGVIIFRVY